MPTSEQPLTSSPAPNAAGTANLQDQLNAEQVEAVLHEDGPLLIFAGAGSGKTRVLTYRLAHLIQERDHDPGRLLAVTFTNKAAREMKERVHQLIGPAARGLWIGTFHAICARILRVDIERLGYGSNFVVFDDGDQQAAMRDALKALNLDSQTYEHRAMMNIVSRQKEALVDEQEYASYQNTPSGKVNARVYHAYQERLRANNALDFDDLITLTVKLLEEHPDIQEKYQQRFQHIMVDEFQDVNYAQYRLVQILAAKWKNITCVGDDDQSIYGWRGADVGLILRFERDFPNVRVIKLEQNYRSTAGILDCANRVVAHNRTRRPKALWTDNPEGEPILHTAAQDERDEARMVVLRIVREVQTAGRAWSDFGILYRTNSQSRVFEEACRSYQVPYRMVGGQRFYERKEIKDIVSYLRLISNPAECLSTLRAIASPSRGIGLASIEHLTTFAEREGINLYTAIIRADEVPGLSARARSASIQFAQTIQELRRLQEIIPVGELLTKLLENTGIMSELRSQKGEEAQERLQNINEFLNTARQFELQSDDTTLPAFLETLALATDLDTYKEDSAAVTLMTLHSAKGLEFPVVFLVGMEEGVFPHSRVRETQAALEEERRLCYVGVTRARERLYVSHAASRMINGITNRSRPSRFLKEMGESLERQVAPAQPQTSLFPGSLAPSGTERARRYEMERGFNRPSPPARQPEPDFSQNGPARSAPANFPTPSSTPPAAFTIGDRVRHKTIGLGVIVGIDPAADTVRVAFEGQGVKKFQLGIAPIVKVER